MPHVKIKVYRLLTSESEITLELKEYLEMEQHLL